MRLLLGCSVLEVFSTIGANRQTNQEQQQTITIGDTELALSMSEELVSKKLGGRVTVSKQDAPEGSRAKGITSTWIIDDKAAQSTRPSLATLAFTSGKLASVRKTRLRLASIWRLSLPNSLSQGPGNRYRDLARLLPCRNRLSTLPLRT